MTDKDNKYLIGLQHGDFNPGNILITRLSHDGDADFTLIDNAKFRNDGRLISDLVYFLYWTCAILIKEQTPKNVGALDKIIHSIYAGYLGALPEESLNSIKKDIFDKKTPLEVARTTSWTYRYKYDFLEHEKWRELVEKKQKEAFYEAYNHRFPNIAMPKLKNGSELSQANHLDWSGKKTDDISSLSKLTNLTSINLSNTNVQAIAPLSTLENLRELDMSYTPVIWVGPLSKLTKLEKLNLSHTKINAVQSNLEMFSSLKNLKELNLESIGLNEVYIAHLQNNIFPKECRIIIAR